ncbi:unnamed protein product [Victoria cruziana]
MAANQEDKEVVGRDPSWRGSNRMTSLNDVEQRRPSFDPYHDHKHQIMHQKEEPGWKKFMGYIGPGFLVSMAYLDPGNMETDLQTGANHKYGIILIGMIFAFIIQSLFAKLGVATVIGTAFAINILFHIPVWTGVLITGLSTMLLLGLQKYGVRKLEALITLLVFVMAACYFAELAYVKPKAFEVLRGLFIPRLKGNGATGDAISLLGALIMPACRYFLLENGFALFVAFLINVSLVAVSDMKMKKWLRNFVTRFIAIAPSLVVSVIGGSAGAGKLIIIASMILSFELPFALIPLLKFSSSENKIVTVSWILGFLIIGINVYYLSTGFVDWSIHNNLPKVGSIFIGIIVFPLMGLYVAAVVYLTIRKDKVVTYVDRAKLEASEAMDHEVPYREDLADIPFPE